MRRFEHSRVHTNLFRGLAAVPPIFAAEFVSNLGDITDYTVFGGFGICFIFPPLLAYFSAKKLKDMGTDPTTIHSNSLTSTATQVMLFTTGVVLLLVVGYFLVHHTTATAAAA